MTAKRNRLRDVVYVVGAGFSAGLGYPLTNNLLVDVWERLGDEAEDRLRKIIAFHHPEFDSSRRTSFPNIEQLLTEIAVNIDLFDASRPKAGNFKPGHLNRAREDLLSAVADWFHEIYSKGDTPRWLDDFKHRLHHEQAAIVSFNWDLVLDHLLFTRDGLSAESYGLGDTVGAGPVLFKPHGSLNWFEEKQVSKVPAGKRVRIFSAADKSENIEAFLYPRAIRSKVGRKYTPLIVAPTYLKDFNRPIFKVLWNQCTAVLSTARRLVFLGYSMPAADLQAQFILRCGFHNQLEGRLSTAGDRLPATGAAEVIIVNPDQGAAQRIERIAGRGIPCAWVPKRVSDWISEQVPSSPASPPRAAA
jgi:hypothetical protein